MTVERSTDLSAASQRVLAGILVVALLPAAALFQAQADGPLLFTTRLEALVLWVLCVWPAWRYVATPVPERPPIPFLPLFGITFGVYFALPLVLGQTNLGGFGSYLREQDYAAAVDAAFLGWVGVLIGERLTRAVVRERAPRTPIESDPHVLMTWAKGLAVGALVFNLLPGWVALPDTFASAVRFFQTLGDFGLALGLVLVVRGVGRRTDTFLLIGVTTIRLVLILVSGSLSGVVFMCVTVLFSIWVGRGRFVVREGIALGLIVILVMMLKAVLLDYREVVWATEGSYTVSERVVVMKELVQDRMDEPYSDGILNDGADRFSSRSAIADVLADVIQRTPSEVPYWNGESYASLIGAFVPRVLWPDKPEKDLGQRFGHRYEYLGARDTGTSVNFPWLVEIYANFGMGFMPVGGAILGMILALLGRTLNRREQSLLVTAAGIALLVPLYNLESDFSLVYGGLILNGVALYAVVRYVERSANIERSHRVGVAGQVALVRK